MGTITTQKEKTDKIETTRQELGQEQKMADNSNNSIYVKLAKMRVELQKANLKKSGLNGFAKFRYFELFDFLPAINELALQNLVVNIISFKEAEAILKIINIEQPNDFVEFSIKMVNATVKGATDIQNLGASYTYLRRYLYMIAYEICESDTVDANVNSVNEVNVSSKNENPTQIYKCKVCDTRMSSEIYKKSMGKIGL